MPEVNRTDAYDGAETPEEVLDILYFFMLGLLLGQERLQHIMRQEVAAARARLWKLQEQSGH